MFGLPLALFNSADAASEASKWLHTTCESFQPHTHTLTHVDLMGMGQLASSFPVNAITGREITFGFREYQHLPILNIIRRWAGVFDPHTGVSPLRGDQFFPRNYKGWAAVAQTKPVRSLDSDLTVQDLEEVWIYQGVQPTNVPVETASAQDITANDFIQLSVTFKFDGAPLTSSEPGVTDKVLELFTGMRTINRGSADNNSTYNRYLENGTGKEVFQFGSITGDSKAEPTIRV
jgi:hypothetical protein